MATITNKQIGLIGLGKMGSGLALNLKEHGWEVMLYNRTQSVAEELAKQGFTYAKDYQELVSKLAKPRVVWLMLPAGEPVKTAIFGETGLAKFLEPGDYLIEGGNSYFEDTKENYQVLNGTGIKFVDAGVSGGPGGARNGACIMVGGEQENFSYLEPLFQDLTVEGGCQFFPGPGAGHFVKMVHNGIEYGMMQSLAEGFDLLKHNPYELDLEHVAEVYAHGSVITSRLVDWLVQAYQEFGPDLNGVSGEVEHTGEGEWTVTTAAKLNIPVEIIAAALEFRKKSHGNPTYTGQVLMALRNEFGGHDINKNNPGKL